MNSIVDGKLARYGFVWKLNPYRIVDKASGLVISYGPHFDLIDSDLETRRNAADKHSGTLFQKADRRVG